MTEAYNSRSELWEGIAANNPMLAMLLDTLAPVISNMTGFDMMPMLNILRFNRQDRPFYEADTAMAMGMRNQFRTMTSGNPSQTKMQAIGRSLMSYFIDDKALAERAVSQTAMRNGGGMYAFGTGGWSMADVTGGWDRRMYGSYNERLVEFMAGVYNTGLDPNISKGQRQMMAAGVLRADNSLLKTYAEARNMASLLGVSMPDSLDKLGDLRQQVRNSVRTGRFGEEEAIEKFDKLIERLEKANKSIELFGEAANTWGRILKTDANTAMQKMQAVLGGDAFASFMGNEQTLNAMGLGLKHVGGVTGRGVNSAMAMVSQAGTYLLAKGGPADTAINVGTMAMMESMGMAGYRVSGESADRMMLQFNADLQTSDASYIYFGGYQQYATQQLRAGRTTPQSQMIREWDQIVRRTGLNVNGINRALGVNWEIGEYAAASQLNFARDAAVMPNGFNLLVYGQGQRELMNNVFINGNVRNANGSQMTYDDVQRLSQAAGMDVMELINTNQTVFSERLRQIVDPRIRNQIISLRTNFENAWNMTRRNNPGVLGSMANYSANEAAAFLSSTALKRSYALDRQRKARIEISKGISGKTMFKSIGDMIRTNANFTLGDILVAAGSEDPSYESLDAINRIATDPETKKELVSRFQALAASEDDETRAFFKEVTSDFIKMSGDKSIGLADAYKRTLGNVIGGEIDSNTGRLRFASFGDDEDISDRYNRRLEQWREDRQKKAEAMKTISTASLGKDLTQLNATEKMNLAERMALFDMGQDALQNENKYDSKSRDALGAYRKAVLEGKGKDAIEEAYKAVKNAKVNTAEFEEKKAAYMEQMGIGKDQASYAAIIAQVAEQVVGAFKATFATGGGASINVRDMTPQ